MEVCVINSKFTLRTSHSCLCLPCPSSLSWNGYLYDPLPQDALFSTLVFLETCGCELSVSLGQMIICDRMWLQLIACPPPTQIYEFNSIIYKLLGERVVFIIFSPLSCYFLARFLMVWTFIPFFGVQILILCGKAFFPLLLCILFRVYCMFRSF